MPETSINAIVAANIQYWMDKRGFATQGALAKKVGVVQRTIGNYLKPKLRKETAKGREPSAKLTELAKIAAALDVEVWHLLRPLSPSEWEAYQAVEAAFMALRKPPPPSNDGQDIAQPNRWAA